MKVIIAYPLGFCAGVERAVKILDKTIEINSGKKIFVKHKLVHNDEVIKKYQQKGVVFIDDPKQAPKGSNVVFSAHGSTREHIEFSDKEHKLSDACCPIVKNSHRLVQKLENQGYHIILIGKKNHQEIKGISGHIKDPKNYSIVNTKLDFDKLKLDKYEKITYLTQTTLSVDDTQELINYIKQKIPLIKAPLKSTICYATQNRQNALKDIIPEIDCLIVIGSSSSSNGTMLYNIGVTNDKYTKIVNTAKDLENEDLGKYNSIGITAAASTPQDCINSIVEYLEDTYEAKTKIHKHTEETEVFYLPKKLR